MTEENIRNSNHGCARNICYQTLNNGTVVNHRKVADKTWNRTTNLHWTRFVDKDFFVVTQIGRYMHVMSLEHEPHVMDIERLGKSLGQK